MALPSLLSLTNKVFFLSLLYQTKINAQKEALRVDEPSAGLQVLCPILVRPPLFVRSTAIITALSQPVYTRGGEEKRASCCSKPSYHPYSAVCTNQIILCFKIPFVPTTPLNSRVLLHERPDWMDFWGGRAGAKEHPTQSLAIML